MAFCARIALRDQPFSDSLFILNFIGSAYGSTVVSWCLYGWLAHLRASPEDHIRPSSSLMLWRYALPFLGLDYVSLLLQTTGCGIVVSSFEGSYLQNQGVSLLFAGCVLQLVTFLIFLSQAAAFVLDKHRASCTPFALAMAESEQPQVQAFLVGLNPSFA